jgi:chaperonin GroES
VTILAVAVEPAVGKLLVRRFEAAKTSKGGIVLAEGARERPSQGEVVAVGPGRPFDGGEPRGPLFEVGQRVVFTKYAGTDIKVSGASHVLLDERDVLAIVGPGVEVE